ncbi:Uma2 family endonuclease [Anabaena sp. FACHB-1237]|uniref:Uma2 family endonuclease n=1 Tax=Anabaena sp. FACHB-1237 TaxID=2692769 RepID=UPI001681A409|nr:Uma2 family endonuclease [Anabaena sp. FACHB-1237]MBD2139025.1 Uma2 family endonuclease [Anabaena sp. FACHB-1237]
MVQQLIPEKKPEIIYPDSDGKPMADNTKQYQWIVKIKENLEILFASDNNIFIAGDLLWYPVEGSVKTCQAPDVMIVFGRPKGDRGSYKQWVENNIGPQVVFEILSPGNRTKEMAKKMLFYQRYGVEEYYIYDPDNIELIGLIRKDEWLASIEEMNNWVSPRLGIRFELPGDNLEDELKIYYPDGRKFLTSIELHQQMTQESERAEQEKQRAEQEKQRAEQESERAEQEKQRAEQESQKYQELLAKLQAKGIDINTL